MAASAAQGVGIYAGASSLSHVDLRKMNASDFVSVSHFILLERALQIPGNTFNFLKPKTQETELLFSLSENAEEGVRPPRERVLGLC